MEITPIKREEGGEKGKKEKEKENKKGGIEKEEQFKLKKGREKNGY